MAERRSILSLRGHFQKTKTETSAGGSDNRHLPALVYNIDVEDQIAQGKNPFMTWARARGVTADAIAEALHAPVAVYRAFEEGHYRGLRDEHIERFCKFMFIGAHQLVGREPVPSALRQVLIKQSFKGRTLRMRECAIFALRNHCDDAEKEMEHERDDQTRRAHSKQIIAFLDMLKSNPFYALECMEPTEILSEMITGHKSQIDHLKTLAAPPKHDQHWRDFQECTLRLYGQGTATKVWDKIAAAAVTHVKAGSAQKFVPDWGVFCDLIRRDPELLGPTLWDEDDGAQFINGRMLRADAAVSLLLTSFDAIRERRKREGVAKTEVEALEAQIKALESWGNSARGQRVMGYWQNRHEIICHLGEKPPLWLVPGPRYLPAPAAEQTSETAKKGGPKP